MPENNNQTNEEIFLNELPDPELFIGIIGAVGTDLGTVISVLKEELCAMNYSTTQLKLSALLREIPIFKKLKDICFTNEAERIEEHMKAGDELRARTKRGDALILLSINNIRATRATKYLKKEEPISRHAFIFDSIKQPTEVESLRKIYGNHFALISAYSPREVRVDKLTEKISKSLHVSEVNKLRSSAERLVEMDANSGNTKLSQNVSGAFHLADFFLYVEEEKEKVRQQVRRFLEAWFGHPFHTPSIDEMGMFLAKAAALRSSDLSRQVGAVLLTKQGEILAMGCNDVPKPGGGISWEGEEFDRRDFRLGSDPSVKVKKEMVAEIITNLKKEEWLATGKMGSSVEDLVSDALFSPQAPFKETRAWNILEFGRVVHAEMNALMEAGRRGISTKGSTLYCTTFPCHMCARHIIAAGIDRVVFIEPYPKSMAKTLYQKELSLEDDRAAPDAVKFTPFIGISPNKFQDLFAINNNRKDPKTGDVVVWESKNAHPRTGDYLWTYTKNEVLAVSFIAKNKLQFGFVLPETTEVEAPLDQSPDKSNQGAPSLDK